MKDTTLATPSNDLVTILVSPDSYELYAAAIALMNEHPFSLASDLHRARPVIQRRIAASLLAQMERPVETVDPELDAIKRGRKLLAETRAIVMGEGTIANQRAYWRKAQRRHRAAGAE